MYAHVGACKAIAAAMSKCIAVRHPDPMKPPGGRAGSLSVSAARGHRGRVSDSAGEGSAAAGPPSSSSSATLTLTLANLVDELSVVKVNVTQRASASSLTDRRLSLSLPVCVCL